jgi:hypothetical protein
MNITERRKRLQELKEQEKSGKTSAATSTTAGSTMYSSSRAQRLAEMKQAEQYERVSAVSSELTSRLDTWFKNNENFVSNYNYRFKGFTGSYNDPYDSTINDWISSVTPQKSNFDQEANNIISWLDTYGDYVGGREWADSVKNALRSAGTQQSEILKNACEYSKYWSQWESPDAYKRYQTISSIADMSSEQIKKYLSKDDPVAYVDDDGKEITWDSLYKSKYYKEFTGKEDFADKSKSGYAAYEADIQGAAEREEAKKKGLIKIILAVFTAAILTVSMPAVAAFAADDNAPDVYSDGAADINTGAADVTEGSAEETERKDGEISPEGEEKVDTGATVTEDKEEENLFSQTFGFLEENSARIFSALSFIASLITVIAYRSGLLPYVESGIKTLSAGVKALGERADSIEASTGSLGESVGEKLLAAEALLARIESTVSTLGERLDAIEKEGRRTDSFKSVLLGEIDMLYDIFMAASIPQYLKESVGERVGAMKRQLAEAKDADEAHA